MAKQNQIVIVGGGIIGVSLAYLLAEAGAEVTVLEQGDVGFGCSYGNAGWVTPCFSMPLPQPGLFFKSIKWLLDPLSPLHIQPRPDWDLIRWLLTFMRHMNHTHLETAVQALTELSIATVDGYKKIASESSFDWHQQGLLMVALSEGGLKDTLLERDLVMRNGVRAETMTGDRVREFEPALKVPVLGGVYFPDEAHVEPAKLVQAIRELAEKKGARFQTQTEVFDWTTSGMRIESVQTTRGEVRGDQFVMATGTWSRNLAKRLGLRVPVLGGKGYSLIVPKQEIMPRAPIMVLEKKLAITPHSDRLRIAGTLELVADDRSISPARLNSLWDGARESLHISPESKPVEIWRGLRPCTPDGVPLLGRTRRYSNLCVATGHQMLGIQSGWGSAELMCDILMGRTPRYNPKPFDPNRF